MAEKVPGSHHLSSQAKRMWDFTTSPKEISHFRKVSYNSIHEYCFFICAQPSCDGCQVVKLKSWMAGLKKMPSTVDGTPVIRNLDTKRLKDLEYRSPKVEVLSDKDYAADESMKNAPTPEPKTDKPRSSEL